MTPTKTGSPELLKLLLLEIPPLRLILFYQVIWPFDIWFAFSIGRNNTYFHIVANIFSVETVIMLICVMGMVLSQVIILMQ